MNPGLVILPLAFPFTAAVVGLFLMRSHRAQRLSGMVGAIGQFAAALILLIAVERHGIHVLQMADWSAPFGISLVADRLSAVMLTFAGMVGAVCIGYSAMTVSAARVTRGYFPLANMLLVGVGASFLTGDLFNLYVSFEVMLIASFVLLALGGTRPQMEGAMKYVALNLVASTMLLAAAGLIYAMAGTLNMADLSIRLAQVESPGLLTAVSVLLLAAFSLKAAIFPLFSWLPASYHTPPADVTALFSGLLTKVGIYAIIRTMTVIIPDGGGIPTSFILIVAGLTMVLGVLGAIAQSDFRRLLSFHIISQIGYLVMGIGLGTTLGLAGAIFFMTHQMVTKTALFLVAGVVERLEGTGWLYHLGGMGRSQPALAAIFGIAALSLAGIPPFVGFVAKLTLIRAGFEIDSVAIVVVALAVSILTLFSMLKIWLAVFWQPLSPSAPPRPERAERPRWSTGAIMMPAAILAAISVGLGLAGGPYLELMLRTAEDAMNPQGYIAAVLEARQ